MTVTIATTALISDKKIRHKNTQNRGFRTPTSYTRRGRGGGVKFTQMSPVATRRMNIEEEVTNTP